MGVGSPLKNISMQHINDSHPKPISDKQVKKEIENGSGIQQSEFSVVQMSDVVFVCPVCKESFGKLELVREHQELIHVEYKFPCDDSQCLRIYKTKCGQKRHWKNKHKPENNKNGTVVVKQEEDQTNVQEQLNVSNVFSVSNTSTGSGNSRGS